MGQQWCEAGKDHSVTGVALPPRKEALGTIFTVCKCLNPMGKTALENQLASVLENGWGVQGSLRRAGTSLLPGQAGCSSSPGQASSYSELPSDGLAGITGSELSIKGGMPPSLMVGI